jgi:hypothetical protein
LHFFSVALLSLPTSFFVDFFSFMVCSFISSHRIRFSILHVSSPYVSLSLESSHTGFFGSFFSASAQAFC